jgi:hypothetical protein
MIKLFENSQEQKAELQWSLRGSRGLQMFRKAQKVTVKTMLAQNGSYGVCVDDF